MNNILKEFLIIAILVIAFLYILQKNKNENLDTSTPLSNEAIQNIASVYNKNNFIASNITSTDNFFASNIYAKGKLEADSIVTKNNIMITEGEIRIGKGGVNSGGDIVTNGGVNATGNIRTDGMLIAAGLRTGGGISTSDSVNASNDINTGNNGRLCLGNVCLNQDMLKAIKVKAGYTQFQM